MEMAGPSAALIIKALVHAATMHTDAMVLRSCADGCGFSYWVGTGDNDLPVDEENMKG